MKSARTRQPASTTTQGAAPFFSPLTHYGSQGVLQRNGEDDKKPAPVKTEVKVETKHNAKEGTTETKGSTTRSTEQKAGERITASAKEKTTDEDRTTEATLKAGTKKIEKGKTGVSVGASASTTAIESMHPSVADVGDLKLKLSLQAVPFSNDTFQLKTGFSLSESLNKGPQLALSSDMLFFRKGFLSPKLAASFIADKKGLTFASQLKLEKELSKRFSLMLAGDVEYSNRKNPDTGLMEEDTKYKGKAELKYKVMNDFYLKGFGGVEHSVKKGNSYIAGFAISFEL